MSWTLKYFEAGATIPHTIEKLHSREAVDQSLLIFERLGGDDDLQLTDSAKPSLKAPASSRMRAGIIAYPLFLGLAMVGWLWLLLRGIQLLVG